MLKKIFFFLGIIFCLFPIFAQESDDEPYLSLDDQEAILDKEADAIMDEAVTAEHKKDSPDPPYIVRIEIYTRTKTSYIPVGDLSLSPGFFSWNHDGRKKNGYAVYMYPVTNNRSKIKLPKGVKRLYGKSFHTAEEAIMEIQTKGSSFYRFIRYQPVIKQMLVYLNQAPYQGSTK